MAGNLNSAPKAFWRNATRFSRLFLSPRRNKNDTNYGQRPDLQVVIVQAGSGQTSNIVEIQDSAGNVLSAFDAAGNLVKSAVTAVKECVATTTISAADIVATGAGKFGHAAGTPLVADAAAGSLVELVSVVMSYTYATAAYGGGGNVTVNSNGGSALTGLIAAGSSIGAGASNIIQFLPLAATGNAILSAKGLNLVAAGAFTQPGTAAGTIRVYTTYRVYSAL